MTSSAVYILCQGAIETLDKKVDNLPKAFIPQGSINFSELPTTPSSSNLGYIWNIKDEFITDDRFIEGAGKKYPAGNNVAVIKHNNIYMFDVMAAIDLSNYYTKVEVNDLFTAERLVRESAEDNLQTLINNETVARTDADSLLRADLDNEISARTSGDTNLQTAINQESITREQADTTLQNNINNKQNIISDLNTIRSGAAKGATAIQEHQDISGKLNILPKVDDPSDPGFGWEYHIPYRFDVSLDSEKANIDLHTLTLDNKVTKMVFNKQVPSATTSIAGLMSAADKVSLTGKQDKLTAGTNITIDENNIISATGGTSVDFDNKTIVKGSDNKYQTAIGGWKETTSEQFTELFIDTKGNGLHTYIGPGTAAYEAGWDYNTTITSLASGASEVIVNVKFTVLGTAFNNKIALYKQSSFPISWESNEIIINDAYYKVKVHDQYIGINNGGICVVAVDTGTDLEGSTMQSCALLTGPGSVIYHPIDNNFLNLDNDTIIVNDDGKLQVARAYTAGKNITISDNTISAGSEYITLTGTSGTLTDEQLAVINDNTDAYISLDGRSFKFSSVVAGRAIIATYINSSGANNDAILINIGSKTWEYNTNQLQPKLTAGTNITIENNVISATGGSEPDTYLSDANVNTDNVLKIQNKVGQDIVSCTVNYELTNAKVKAVLSDSEKETLLSGVTGTTWVAANTNITANTEALGGLKFKALTQAEYDALKTKDANTLYIIKNT